VGTMEKVITTDELGNGDEMVGNPSLLPTH
jgi:hypothetical protein